MWEQRTTRDLTIRSVDGKQRATLRIDVKLAHEKGKMTWHVSLKLGKAKRSNTVHDTQTPNVITAFCSSARKYTAWDTSAAQEYIAGAVADLAQKLHQQQHRI